MDYKVRVGLVFSLLAMVFLAGVPQAVAQDTQEVQGTVVDAQAENPLPGVNVVVEGTSIGTTTGSDGGFSLGVPSLQDSLRFSFVGYTTRTVAIDGRTDLGMVTLSAATEEIGEVVVTGYTEQEAADVTSSVETADVGAMQAKAVTNTAQALQGAASGVQVSAMNGNPGSNMNVTIRGISSFSGNNDPLVIVDGVEVESGLTNLNSSDIESIQILKDASSAAIYGSQAANGVILVETKTGESGETRLRYQNYVGVQQPRDGAVDATNTEEYVTILQRMYGDDLSQGQNVPQAAKDYLDNPDQFETYDWQSMIYDRALMHSHDLAVSGGNDMATFRISGGYLYQDGITLGTGYERANLRARGEVNVNEDITVNSSISLNKSHTDPEATAFTRASYQNAVQLYPYFSPKTEDGSWRTSSFYYGGGTNPEALRRNPFHYNSLENDQDYGDEISLNLGVEYEILDGLTYDVSGSYFQRRDRIEDYFGDKGANQGEYFDANNSRFTSEATNWNWNIDNTARYSGQFGNHEVDITAGFVAQEYRTTVVEGGANNYLSEQTITIDGPGAQNSFVGGFESGRTQLSIVGQAFYGYDSRYLLTVNFRRDGASRFAPEYRWGNFPGVSVGWRVANEGFWESTGLSNTITGLKLRAGYGILGRQNVGNYPYSPVLNFESVPFGSSISPGLITGTPVNRAVTWEELVSRTVGLDYELFDGMISGSFEYYRNETQDMIIDQEIAPSAGGGVLSANRGKLTNDGFEMNVDYNDSAGDFEYTAGFNLGTTNATIENIGSELITGVAPEWDVPHVMETHEGSGLAEFWLIETDGLFRSQQEVQNHTCSDGTVIQPNAQPGDVRFVDANGDCSITNSGDRQLAGSGIPDVNVGFNFSASYGDFDMRLNLTGAFGHEVYNVARYLTMKPYGFENFNRELLDAYHPERNPDSDIPRLNPNDVSENWNARPTSDRFLEDGDYVKVRNLEFGYNLPSGLAGSVLRSARIYVRAQNLLTITGYSGMDPEVGSSPIVGQNSGSTNGGFGIQTFSQGLARDVAPQTRSFQAGVNLQF